MRRNLPRSVLGTACILLASCTNSVQSVRNDEVQSNRTETTEGTTIFSNFLKEDTTYMRTGLYFLEDSPANGIKMKDRVSGDIYIISKKPFASVDNIVSTNIVEIKDTTETYTELCLKFDKKGTKDMTENTGNPLHPKIALVLAGELRSVAANEGKVTAGELCVDMGDYTKEEMLRIKASIDQKK